MKWNRSWTRDLLVFLTFICVILYIQYLRNSSDKNVAAVHSSEGQVRLLLGVLTTWQQIERRHMLRYLYPVSLNNLTSPFRDDVIRTIFVVGEPVSEPGASIVEWESQTYGDIMVLDGVNENMNSGKTYNFFKALHDRGILYQDGDWTHVAKVDDDTW
jgi:hypothetical protein